MPPFIPPNHAIFSKSTQKLTDSSNKPCVINSLVNLCYQGKIKEAVESLSNLARKGLRLDGNTLAILLKECARTKSLREGKWVHSHLRYTGQKRPTTLVANYLIHMYFECGDHNSARQVFDKMSVRNLYSWNNTVSGYVKLGMLDAAKRMFDKMGERDVVSWNTMVIGYAQGGRYGEAVRFYREFRRAALGYNAFSFAGILTVGVKLQDLRLTKQVHCQVFVTGFDSSLILGSSILDAYAKCGEMRDARRVFDEMQVRDIPVWTSLIAGYCKWGNMQMARELFDLMPEKNPYSWTAMVSGYARNKFGDRSLDMFRRMILLRIRPDQFTFSSSLCACACASLASLRHGKQIHAYMIRTGFKPNTIVVSSLIDMYSKCGSLFLSKRVFLLMANKQDVMTWNPVIAALSNHGHGDEAIELFDEMVNSGVKPNRVTFVIILSACSHSGLVNPGLSFFKSMTEDHNIHPDVEHYACLVDLLGRAGCFDELVKQLEIMPCKGDDRIRNTLIGVCRINENVELGRKTAEQLIERCPQDYAPYLLLSSIDAAAGNWESVEMTRRLMSQRCVRKKQASSWAETGKKVNACSSVPSPLQAIV
ncbi:pentatricopeptide repeat-containing protein At2g21090 [Silene latifolia]|uniref:pentatricopeptide repeat-containing protein At2g21090 n=1 Tax=Silene latifolia TaxID=37657 RepID=UPI003D76EC0C